MKTVLLLFAIAFTSIISFGQLAYVGTTTQNQLSVIDLDNESVLSSINTGGSPTMGAFNSSFSKFYVPIFETASVLEINPLTHTVNDTIPVGLSPTQLILNQDNTLAYVCNQGSNSISVIDLATNNVYFSFSVGIYPNQMALSSDESLIYITNTFDSNIGVYSTNTFIQVTTIPLSGFPVGLRISPDGSQLYCSVQSTIGELAIIETGTYTIDTMLTIGVHPHDVMVNNAGTAVYVTCLDNNTVSRVDLATNLITVSNTQQYPTCIASGLTEDYYYVTNTNSGSISKIDPVTNAVVSNFPSNINPYGISVFPGNVGISELDVTDLSVYPNPNNGSFTIQLPANNGSEQRILLQTADGKRIASYTTNQSVFQLNEVLANGFYFLTVEGEHSTSSAKIEVSK